MSSGSSQGRVNRRLLRAQEAQEASTPLARNGLPVTVNADRASQAVGAGEQGIPLLFVVEPAPPDDAAVGPHLPALGPPVDPPAAVIHAPAPLPGDPFALVVYVPAPPPPPEHAMVLFLAVPPPPPLPPPAAAANPAVSIACTPPPL